MSMTKPTSEQVTFLQQGLGAVQRNVVDKLRETVSVTDFGAKGDGVTDDTAAIQAAIDWVAYRNLPWNASKPVPFGGSVYLPAGKYRITDTIHLGYGTTYSSIRMYGDGRKYRGEGYSFAGTAIFADFNDRPAIAVTGGRRTTIESLTVVGNNAQWVESQNLGAPFAPGPAVDDLVAANWVDPSFPASSTSQYSPYCGIAIDPYAGPRPAVSYPDVNFPSWLNYTTQYNALFSQGTTLRDIEIGGFVVGIAVQPCDADGNGDYTRLLNGMIERCQYGISVGNTQAKDFAVRDVLFANNYCGISTSAYGRKNGEPAFDVGNCSFLHGIWWAIMPNMQFGSQVAFRNCYMEAGWGIGLFSDAGQGTGEGSVTFDECDISFELWPLRGVPKYVLASSGPLFVRGCTFAPPNMPYSSAEPNIICIRSDPQTTSFTGNTVLAGRDATYLYEKQAVNSTAGVVFVGTASTNMAEWSCRQPVSYDMSTGNQLNIVYRGLNKRLSFDANSQLSSTRLTCMPVYATHACLGDSGTMDPGIPIPPLGGRLISKAACTSVSQSGSTVTLDVTGATTADVLFQNGGDVGDIIVDNETTTVFIVAARTGLSLTLKAQNNLDASGNLIPTITITTNNFATMNCRVFTLFFPHYGNLSSSSATISNVACADGVSRSVNSATQGVQIGDAALVGNGTGPGISSLANAYVTNVTSNSIVLTGNARYTATRERLGLFVKKPTANNT